MIAIISPNDGTCDTGSQQARSWRWSPSPDTPRRFDREACNRGDTDANPEQVIARGFIFAAPETLIEDPGVRNIKARQSVMLLDEPMRFKTVLGRSIRAATHPSIPCRPDHKSLQAEATTCRAPGR